MSENAETLISKYIDLRDRKAELKKAFDADVAKLDKAMETIETYLMHLMNELGGVENIKTGVGTAYRSARTKASIADRQLARDFVLRTGNLDLLELRASSKGVEQYVEEHKALPAGFSTLVEESVTIRRSN